MHTCAFDTKKESDLKSKINFLPSVDTQDEVGIQGNKAQLIPAEPGETRRMHTIAPRRPHAAPLLYTSLSVGMRPSNF